MTSPEIKRKQHQLIAALLGLQGLLLVLGDMGCYLSWQCPRWLNWHGHMGLAFLGAGVIMLLVIWIQGRVAKSDTHLG